MVMGVRTADLPGKIDEKLKSENMQKKSIIQYFRVHHFVVKFSQFSSPQAAKCCERSC